MASPIKKMLMAIAKIVAAIGLFLAFGLFVLNLFFQKYKKISNNRLLIMINVRNSLEFISKGTLIH